MERAVRFDVCLCIFFTALCVIITDGAPHIHSGVAPEFSQYREVYPRLFHAREKREITSTRDMGGGHINDITVAFDMNGDEYVMDLQLNRNLVPGTYFQEYQHNGKRIVNRPTHKEVELCDYQGTLRGYDESWVAVSTCDGLRGVIFDGKHLYYLERNPNYHEIKDSTLKDDEIVDNNESKTHFLYIHSDLDTNHTYDFHDSHHDVFHDTDHDTVLSDEYTRNLRGKRAAEMVQGPYKVNKTSRYVELVLVVDNRMYKAHGERLDKVYERCKNIANIVNALYTPLNIFIALVGVVVWTENDEINISPNGQSTLSNFLAYRQQRLTREHPNDNAQLLTKVQFEYGAFGKGLKGPICTYEFSGGVNTDFSSVVGLVAASVAHTIGHNFGMEHDTSECTCPSEHCIMAPSISSEMSTHWSSCSLEYLDLAFSRGMDYCLRNKPKSLFDGPVCGNGFVEAGEQCDCGLPQYCDNPCCNATVCKLYNNATCATGECCDMKTCHLMKGGTVCRSAVHECDLPEYCTGHSEYCPNDVYKMDGEMCSLGKAYCYQGSCQTHSDQCRLLWGSSGRDSDRQCYQLNKQGNRYGNCGYDHLNQSYHKCNQEDIYCGLLQCVHFNDRLEFGMESVATLSRSFVTSGGNIIPCRSVLVDLGFDKINPGLVPNGAKCGEGKMCVNQKCVPVNSLRDINACHQNCTGGGICNSRGHCHCAVGLAPPLCDTPGPGGSEDSGPASVLNVQSKKIVIQITAVHLLIWYLNWEIN